METSDTDLCSVPSAQYREEFDRALHNYITPV